MAGICWTEQESEIVKNRYVELGAVALVALLPGRTSVAIQFHATQLGLTRRKKWTAEENRIIHEKAPLLTMKELLKFFPGRTRQTLKSHVRRLGLTTLRTSFSIDVGTRFNKLIVLEAVSDNKSLVQCDCGRTRVLPNSTLRLGILVSCGCSRFEVRTLPGQHGQKAFINSVKGGAKERGYPVEVSNEYLLDLSQEDCYYCGILPSQVSGYSKGGRYKEATKKNGDFIHNGIDRKDNTKGYVKGNCVACCKVCNMAKRMMTLDEFYQWIFRLITHTYKQFPTLMTPFLKDLLSSNPELRLQFQSPGTFIGELVQSV